MGKRRGRPGRRWTVGEQISGRREEVYDRTDGRFTNVIVHLPNMKRWTTNTFPTKHTCSMAAVDFKLFFESVLSVLNSSLYKNRNCGKWMVGNMETIKRDTRDWARWRPLVRDIARAIYHHSWWDRTAQEEEFPKPTMNYDTVEPLSNDHPHQRPSLLYDHISCDVVGAAQHI